MYWYITIVDRSPRLRATSPTNFISTCNISNCINCSTLCINYRFGQSMLTDVGSTCGWSSKMICMYMLASLQNSKFNFLSLFFLYNLFTCLNFVDYPAIIPQSTRGRHINILQYPGFACVLFSSPSWLLLCLTPLTIIFPPKLLVICDAAFVPWHSTPAPRHHPFPLTSQLTFPLGCTRWLQL